MELLYLNFDDGFHQHEIALNKRTLEKNPVPLVGKHEPLLGTKKKRRKLVYT